MALPIHLPSNPALKKHLDKLLTQRKASAAELNAIPALAGNLSFDEEEAIHRTLTALGRSVGTRPLVAYLDEAGAARGKFIDAQNVRGRRAVLNSRAGIWVSGAFGLAAAAVALATDAILPGLLGLWVGIAGSVWSGTSGYFEAGEVDRAIDGYGRRD